MENKTTQGGIMTIKEKLDSIRIMLDYVQAHSTEQSDSHDYKRAHKNLLAIEDIIKDLKRETKKYACSCY